MKDLTSLLDQHESDSSAMTSALQECLITARRRTMYLHASYDHSSQGQSTANAMTMIIIKFMRIVSLIKAAVQGESSAI